MTVLPVRFDGFALIMLLGVAQGGLLSLFFLTGGRQAASQNAGWLLPGQALLSSDVLLGYINYMFRVCRSMTVPNQSTWRPYRSPT